MPSLSSGDPAFAATGGLKPRGLASSRRRAGAKPGLGAPTVYAAIAFAVAVYLFGVVGVFTRFPGTLGDARFNQQQLEHLWLWATGRVDSLADPAFFYPYRDILYFSVNHFGTGAVYGLARALGGSREAAFDVWFLVGMATTFAASLYAFARLGAPALSATVGAVLFTFSMPMLAQDPHAQLVYRFGVPLAVLASLRFVQRPSLRSACLVAIWVAWQFLCEIYIGVFLVELLGLIGAAALLRPSALPRPVETAPAPPKRAADFALAVVALAALAAVALMLARYAEVAQAYAIRRDMFQLEQMAPHWYSLLSMEGAPSVGWLTHFWPHDGEYFSWEHQLFPGVGVLILAAAGAWFGSTETNGRRVVFLCLVAIVGLVLPAMDFGGVGLYRVLYTLPGLNAIRSMGRVVLVAAFPLAWLAALGVTALRRAGTQGAALALTVGLGFALFDIATYRSASVPFEVARARVAEMERGLDAEALRARRAVLIRFGKQESDVEKALDVDLMLAVQEMGLRTFNGYSGSYPPRYIRPRNCADVFAVVREAEALPYKRAGAEDLAARATIVPPGACGP